MKSAYVNDVLYSYLAPPSGVGGEPLRVEPDYAHFAPAKSCLDPGRLLYARFPADVTPELWAGSWPTAREASEYRLHRREGATVVRYERSYDGEDGQSFLVMPYVDIGMAVTRAAREAYESDPEEQFVERPDFDFEELRRASESREVGWVHPIPDATGRRPPIWGVSVSRMCKSAGFSPRGDSSMIARQAMLETMLEKWDGLDRDGASSGDLLPPAGGQGRARFFGLAWFPDDVGDSGPIPPPEPESEAIGTVFQHGGREWTVVRAWEPVDERRGWMYEVVADDDFVAGLTQAGYERHILGAEMADVVPWRRDGVTYGDVAGLVEVSFTEAHRRLHFETVRGNHAPGEQIQLFEDRRDGEWVVEYDCREVDGEPRYIPVSEWPYASWRDLEPIQTILQSEEDRLGEDVAAILSDVEEVEDADDEEDSSPSNPSPSEEWGGGPLADLAAAALESSDGGDEGGSSRPSPSRTSREPESDTDTWDEELQADIWDELGDV